MDTRMLWLLSVYRRLCSYHTLGLASAVATPRNRSAKDLADSPTQFQSSAQVS